MLAWHLSIGVEYPNWKVHENRPTPLMQQSGFHKDVRSLLTTKILKDKLLRDHPQQALWGLMSSHNSPNPTRKKNVDQLLREYSGDQAAGSYDNEHTSTYAAQTKKHRSSPKIMADSAPP